jgi:hypothetical protein
MAKQALPCPTVLRQLLRYEPKTGKLFWKPRARFWFTTDNSHKLWNAKFADQPAMSAITKDLGYLVGNVLNRRIYAHRVAWAIVSGAWPHGQIDHINGNRADNRLANLRDVTSAENRKNTKRRSDNTSGTVGVAKKRNGWRARIHKGGKEINLGTFETFEQAKAARDTALIEYGYHKNHGRVT